MAFRPFADGVFADVCCRGGGVGVGGVGAEFLALKHDSNIFRQSSNPVCGFSMMEQVRLCAVWFTENWLGSSMNHRVGRLSENATAML